MVLTISGSDPSGGAGLEADLKVLHQHGVHGMAAPTLLTVQNTTGVRKVKSMEPEFLEEQLAFLVEDIFPDVIKIGAIGSRSVLQALIRFLSQQRLKGVKLVVDTVIQSTSGAGLFDMRGMPDFMDRLLPLATVITPNVPEFELLTGRKTTPSTAAAHLRAFGRDKPYAILLKGGHFPGDPVDYLYHAQTVATFPGRRVDTPHTHGTGCALASAIAANLALGSDLPDAIARARGYVQRAIEENPGLGRGKGPIGLWAEV
ncbi:MAG TPA: bifunctional hydroxymethylpyrimidine kinase/phosphomethylpyrimidine kinase [Fibrobacteria bacterium]|nr:bifunctional hydroxymethylpyrimidine kinase/phosphomethylpyrimidine kinase [Fibrobacteria bacterium]